MLFNSQTSEIEFILPRNGHSGSGSQKTSAQRNGSDFGHLPHQ
jgi:hypothetical protein